MNTQDLKKILDESDNKYRILTDKNIISEYDVSEREFANLINIYLTDEQKLFLLHNTEFVLEKLNTEYIKNIVRELKEDKAKLDIIEIYQFEDRQIESIISSFSIDSLVELFSHNKEFLEKYKIKPYLITKNLSNEKQIEIISRIEELGCTNQEKKLILATLSSTVKQEIDTANFPQEYKDAIQMEICQDFTKIWEFDKIIINLNDNPEKYKDLDEIIFINPMNITNKEREFVLNLCKVCPNLKTKDNNPLSSFVGGQEYLKAEEWIESVMQGIDENWKDIQKIAYIDNAIGKKISYSPDYGTEIFDHSDSRTLWKIINSGYGVCNGIAQVEKYMLDRIGIESELISGHNHTFLKIKNLTITNLLGEVIQGNTVLDPTWNLCAHRYGGRPMDFCRSYEEIRNNDIEEGGTDMECHKNDEELADATLELDIETLRRVFTSIGVADIAGDFPVKEFIEKSKAIDDELLPADESIKRQLLLLTEYCPEFAICKNETTSMLKGISLNQKNLKFNKCVVNRVYERNDTYKKTILYVYVNLAGEGKKFYFADKEAGEFIELTQKEFESRFECYDNDLEKYNGIRPWEDTEEIKHSKSIDEGEK